MILRDKIRETVNLLRAEMKRCFVCREKSGAKRHILIVRLDGIGDFFIWLPDAVALQAYYADAEVTLLANCLWSEAAEKLLSVDRVIPFNPQLFLKDFNYRIGLLTQLRRKGFDVILQPRFSREFLVEDMITRWCAAPQSIAFRSDQRSINPRLMPWSDHWYTDLVVLPEEIKNEKLINGFWTKKITKNKQNNGLDSSNTAISLDFSCLSALPEKWISKPYYLIIPGAADPRRRWPPEKLAEVAVLLRQRSSLRGIICGSREDRAAAAVIMKKVCDESFLDITGKTRIIQLIALIGKAQFLVGNDTGAMHIAVSCGVNAFCILGGGQWGRFLPYPAKTEWMPDCIYHKMDCYNCNWQCIYFRELDEPYPCVNAVSVANVDTVLKEMENKKLWKLEGNIKYL